MRGLRYECTENAVYGDNCQYVRIMYSDVEKVVDAGLRRHDGGRPVGLARSRTADKAGRGRRMGDGIFVC
jgi:hypothetical protein